MHLEALPNDIQNQLFQCIFFCEDTLEWYRRYITDLKSFTNHSAAGAEQHQIWIDADTRDFESSLARCWHATNELRSLGDLIPSPPGSNDTIDQKSDSVRRLMDWAIRQLPVPQIDVAEVVRRMDALLNVMAAAKPFDFESTEAINEALWSLRKGCIAAKIRYLKAKGIGPIRHRLIQELHQLARISVPPTPRSVNGGYYHENTYRAIKKSLAVLDPEIIRSDKSKELKSAKRSTPAFASTGDEERWYDFINSNSKLGMKQIVDRVNADIRDGKYDKKFEFTSWNGLKKAANRHAKTNGLSTITLRE